MSNKILVCVAFVMICFSSIAQKELQINYSVKNNEVPSFAKGEASLRANSSCELFTEMGYGYGGYESRVNQSFKDYTTNKVWTIDNEESIVKEDMNLFKWELSSQIDTILTYACRKAKCTFRGRRYEVWFTTDLPFRAAPWKVHGLPGVILKLAVDDDYYVLEPISLSIIDTNEEIENPFKGKKCLTWDEYLIVYKKRLEMCQEFFKSEGIKQGKTIPCTIPKIEIIAEENRYTRDEMAKNLGIDD